MRQAGEGSAAIPPLYAKSPTLPGSSPPAPRPSASRLVGQLLNIKGTLARGRLADFAVLSDDLLGVAPEGIGEMAVGATVVGGRVAHDTGALKVV